MRQEIKQSRRIVVKVGTSTLTHESGKINLKKLESIARVLSDLQNAGKEVILVSSGAMGIGGTRLGLSEKPTELKMKQATAAIGQAILMQIYEKFFGEYNQVIAQVLLTKDVMTDAIKKENAKNTLSTLLEVGAIPIINENDCVSTAEIEGYRFGDNDTLSATVAELIEADVLVLLTDIDGLYTDNPRTNKGATLISKVEVIDESVENLAKGEGSKFGTGGMITKIIAANIAKKSYVHTIIASGEDINILYNLLEGEEEGTWFVPDRKED